jgi:hypothetical protein
VCFVKWKLKIDLVVKRVDTMAVDIGGNGMGFINAFKH